MLFKRRASGLAALMLTFAAPTIAQSAELSLWSELFHFKPDAKTLIEARSKRLQAGDTEKKYEVQRIADGSGKYVNFDEYSITIDQMPVGMNKAGVFKYFRENLDSLLDTSVARFIPYAKSDVTDWKKSPAQLGTIMIFEIKLGGGLDDKGAVVVSRASAETWIFSPIKSGIEPADFGTHPVAGNREFGIREMGGKVQIYTRAADRVYPTLVALAEGKAFSGADALWKSMQDKTKAYIEKNGGKATVNTPIAVGGLDKKPAYTDVCATKGFDCKN